MTDAKVEIRRSLEVEGRERVWRSVAWVLTLGAGVSAMAVARGVSNTGPQHLAEYGLALAVIAASIAVSATPRLRLGPLLIAGIAALAVLSPLIVATRLTAGEEGWRPALACGTIITLMGAAALGITAVVLGKTRRRFGGASILQGLAAALAAATGVAFQCPGSSAVHALSHMIPIAVVAVLLRRFLLR